MEGKGETGLAITYDGQFLPDDDIFLSLITHTPNNHVEGQSHTQCTR